MGKPIKYYFKMNSFMPLTEVCINKNKFINVFR